MWPDRRLLDLLEIELPIVQAPMAGATDAAMAIAVSESGGLGSLPCALLTPGKARAEIEAVRRRTSRTLNVNFFCHSTPRPDAAREAVWRSRFEPYYAELAPGASPSAPMPNRTPFDDAMCDVVEEFRPEVVSFHFGLPEPRLLGRVKALGCKVLSSATTVDEARWLADHGCDAVIAQGCEAGGHRGMFLTDAVDSQPGTMALVPQAADAVEVPIVAAGGIADGPEHRRRIRARSSGGADRDRVSARVRVEDFRPAPRRPRKEPRRRHGADQHFHRSARSRAGESNRA